VCKGSNLAATVRWNSVPLLPGVMELACAGIKTGASSRNWSGYGQHVDIRRHTEVERNLLTDPQTSGGLLVTCAPDAVAEVMSLFLSHGFDRVAEIGEMHSGLPTIHIE
ncbi:MAG: selenide, water dikinase SelD, partial [Burkholderiales bacterium]